jgi:phosphatidylserine decarboxylase
MERTAVSAPFFEERLRGRFAPDVRTTALPTAVVGGLLWAFAGAVWAAPVLVLAAFLAAFFRNPERVAPPDPNAVIAPADGKVLAVGEIECADGSKALRIGIFLSVFDVHVNRAPVAGEVVSIERSGDAFLAAFNPAAETRNVQLAMTLRTAAGRRVRVVQITGLIARRIVCQPRVGEWLGRGVRYGLIRFGSRTDVVLPLEARAAVREGERVWGGRTVIATLEGAAS